MLDNVASELFLINACSSGKFQNVKWFLAKMWKYISRVLKVVEEETKEKKPESCQWFKEVRQEQDEEVFGKMASWPAVATAWSQWGGGGGKLLGEWKLIRPSAFFGLLARLANALKIKCPTLYYWPIIAIKLYNISFFISGILLQQPRAPLKGVSAHFSNVYCVVLKEMRGREIFNLPGYLDVTRVAGPILLKLGRATKMAVFLDLFSRFRWGTENQGFIWIKKFFHRGISNKK